MHRLDFVFWSQTKILRKVKFDEFEIQMCNSQCKCYVPCILSRKPRSFLTKTLAQKVQQELPLCTRLVYQVPLVYPVGSPILPMQLFMVFWWLFISVYNWAWFQALYCVRFTFGWCCAINCGTCKQLDYLVIRDIIANWSFIIILKMFFNSFVLVTVELFWKLFFYLQFSLRQGKPITAALSKERKTNQFRLFRGMKCVNIFDWLYFVY